LADGRVRDAARANGSNPTPRRARKKQPTCDDCFFRRHNLCALQLPGPCPTFRPDTGEGLVPPLQPALLMRQAREGRIAGAAWHRAA
jgi:hypothetical protein